MKVDEFISMHAMGALVSIKDTCKILNVGQTRFYELVKEGRIDLIANGSRRNVAATQIFEIYQDMIMAPAPARRINAV